MSVHECKWHGGSGACTACTAASQQEGHGFDPRMGRCWLWGAGLPQSSGGLSPGPFSVEFACSPRVHKGFPPLRTPTEKHAEEKNRKRSLSCPSVTKTEGSLDLVPVAPKGCPLLLGSWTVRDGKNAGKKFTATSVCVWPPKMHVCRLCHKKLTEISLVLFIY